MSKFKKWDLVELIDNDGYKHLPIGHKMIVVGGSDDDLLQVFGSINDHEKGMFAHRFKKIGTVPDPSTLKWFCDPLDDYTIVLQAFCRGLVPGAKIKGPQNHPVESDREYIIGDLFCIEDRTNKGLSHSNGGKGSSWLQYNGTWATVVEQAQQEEQMDDIIRVGDIVERICHSSSLKIGGHYVVDKVISKLSIRLVGYGVTYDTNRFKKIKQGAAPIAATFNQFKTEHGIEVPRTPQQDGRGAIGRAAERPDAGRQSAAGIRHRGNPARTAGGEKECRQGTLRPSVARTGSDRR